LETGALRKNTKNELNQKLFNDPSEKYRDFLNSYEYRLFGKS
jgi:hypothetical protein